MTVAEAGVTFPVNAEIGLEAGTRTYSPVDEEKTEPSPSLESISFVIPAYNEGERIYHNLRECLHVVRKLGMPFEMVVVDDGSQDNTASEVERFALNHPEVTLVSYAKNAGKGNALKMGSRRARGDLVVFLDADMEIHPAQIGTFITEMRRTNADLVIGSKRHPLSNVDYPVKRRFLSWGFHLVIKTMFELDVSDTQPGLKLFKREVLDRELCRVEADRYAFDLDLLVNASMDGYKIVEAPIELKFSREFGGRLGFKTVTAILSETLKIRKRIKRDRKQKIISTSSTFRHHH